MPNTTNLVLPYPAAGDNPAASVLAAMVAAADVYAGPWVDYTLTITQSAGVAATKIYAKYRFVGKQCEWAFVYQLTANGTAGQPVLISLPPIAPKYSAADIYRGCCETGTPGTIQELVQPSGSTTQVRVVSFGGNFTTQLTTSSVIRGWGRHEVT